LTAIVERQRELQQRQAEIVRGRREVSPEAFILRVAGIAVLHRQVVAELGQLTLRARPALRVEPVDYLDPSLLS
jgi:hypothetical protein